ncbi:MAG: TonB-dependent receptor, partial [Candidatus Sulfotelmatobacter sp.]
SMVTTTSATPYCSTPPCPLYPGGLGMGSSTIAIRADQTGSASGPKTVTEFFNTSSFTQAVGHFGSSSTGAVLGPGYQIWDMSLMKNTNLGERVNLQLRLETFNTFNHGSPSSIDTNVNDGAFGGVNGWHDSRNLQIGAKIRF